MSDRQRRFLKLWKVARCAYACVVAPDQRGAAFGLRQALDSVGAFAGPLLAVGLMLLWADDIRAVFWVAAIPGLLAVLVAMNLVYSGSAYPLGRMADRMSHTTLLAGGLVALLLADLILAASNHWGVVILGVAVWGLHMGMTQGLLAAMVAHTAPADLRGTAFGAFNLVSGIALLLASVLAGLLWDKIGAPATFLAGAIFCTVSLLYLLRSSKISDNCAP